MKTLDNIFEDIKFGDIILTQEVGSDGTFSKPNLICVVGVDVMDMALTIHYTNYKQFSFGHIMGNGDPITQNRVTIKSFPEWTEYLNILGHWNTMPPFKELLKSYRLLS